MRGFYAIVDPEHCGSVPPLQMAQALLRGGCAVLQLRAKGLRRAELVVLAQAMAAEARQAAVPFVVNDQPDVALDAGADGVHLGQNDMPIEEARLVMGDRLIGISTHSVAQARDAVARGADLIGVGPVFETRTKQNPDPVVGVEMLAQISRASPIPVVAIGGISEETIDQVGRAGAAMAASIAAVLSATDPEEQARRLHQRLSQFL